MKCVNARPDPMHYDPTPCIMTSDEFRAAWVDAQSRGAAWRKRIKAG